MNSDKNSLISWSNIIASKEFQISLDTECLKEVSLVSKLVREKLKPILFKCIAISEHNFTFTNDPKFNEFFILLFKFPLNYIIPNQFGRVRKNLNIEGGINNIYNTLNFAKFTKSFYLENVGRGGFYLFQIASKLDNLTTLKLRLCSIQYSDISKIGVTLPSLKRIELNNVYLVRSPSNNISPGDFIFPSKLYHLEIFFCKVINNESMLDPYQFIFSSEFAHATHNDFRLPKNSVPSLKSLTYYTDDTYNIGLLEFLKINPNLGSLKIDNFNYILSNVFNNLKSFEFNLLPNPNINYPFPTLKSIVNLNIDIIGIAYLEDIKRICSSCPNLVRLYFKMNRHKKFQILINNYIEPILSNMIKLKTFELVFNIGWYITSDYSSDDGSQAGDNAAESLDFSNLSNMKTLILETDSLMIFNLKFENSKSLKEVVLYCPEEKINTQDFINKFNGYSNWKFKFSDHTIKGFRIIN